MRCRYHLVDIILKTWPKSCKNVTSFNPNSFVPIGPKKFDGFGIQHSDLGVGKCPMSRMKFRERATYATVWRSHKRIRTQKRLVASLKGVYDPAVNVPKKSPTHNSAMEQFRTLSIHCPKYRATIRKRCRFAVIPTQVEGHIKAKHGRTISRSQARSIADTVSHMSNVARTPEEVVYPDSSSQPVEWMPVAEDGRRCIVT